eukprot:TRINITY_DN5266_c0_g1_i4.p1 TRINITY_DN5266_c0_g1~~TRINITY_DN5266_c0_g1_i4.p1  ORF type:complete len:647 (+),score=290.07 TRINITY_DN5266_c0_g1_i4:43-1941(+)
MAQYTPQQLQALQQVLAAQQQQQQQQQQQAGMQQYYRQQQGAAQPQQQQQQQQQQSAYHQYYQQQQGGQKAPAQQQQQQQQQNPAATSFQQYQQYQQRQQQQAGAGDVAKLQSKLTEIMQAARVEEAHLQSNTQYAHQAYEQQQRQEMILQELVQKEKELAWEKDALDKAKVELANFDATIDTQKARVGDAQQKLAVITDHSGRVVEKAAGAARHGFATAFYPHSRSKKTLSQTELRAITTRVPPTVRCLNRTWLSAADRKADVHYAKKDTFTVSKESADAVLGKLPSAPAAPVVTVRVLLVECEAFDEHPHYAQTIVGRQHNGQFDLYTGHYDPDADGADPQAHTTHCNIARRVLKDQAGVELPAATEFGVVATLTEEAGTMVYLLPGVAAGVMVKALETDEEAETTETTEEAKVTAQRRVRLLTPTRHSLQYLLANDAGRLAYVTLGAKILDEIGKYRLAQSLLTLLKRLPDPPATAAAEAGGEVETEVGKKRKRDDDEEGLEAPAAKRQPGAGAAATPELHDRVVTTVTMDEEVDCAAMQPFLLLDKPSEGADGKFVRSGIVSIHDVMGLLLSVAQDTTYEELLKLTARIGLDEGANQHLAYRTLFTKQPTQTKQVVSTGSLPNHVRLL